MEDALGGICEFCCLCCCEILASGGVSWCCELACLCFGRSDESKRTSRDVVSENVDRNTIQESETLITQPTASVNENTSNQTADVWNISGRVNHEAGPITAENQRWPTHDHHITMNSYTLDDSASLQLKDRLSPPPYTEVDLPSYEQATGNAKPKTDLVNVHITPQTTSTNEAAGTSQ